MGAFQTFIGLEIHIHLLTESKVFCGCKSAYGDPPNTNVCPVCLGYPGVLPVVNREALKMSYMVGKALRCKLSEHTVFERKNYFYPDMTKNYQITQFSDPVGTGGYFAFELDGKLKRVRIHDIHLEEDAGKMIHDGSRSLLDYNRAGTSLLEIVTEPDLSSGEEAEKFLQDFRRLVRYLGVCDGNMEEGSLRCDANISINRKGKGLGTKVEIKNLNSSRYVKKAMQYEYKRQARTIKTGGKIIQETRLWNEERQKTLSMRTKEAAHDYRYFSEPDIPPFCPDQEFMAEVDNCMTELPQARKERILVHYGLTDELAEFLTDEKTRADYFEAAVAAIPDGEAEAVCNARECAKWMKGELSKQLGRRDMELESSSMTPQRLAAIIAMLQSGDIHNNIARQLVELVLDKDGEPQVLIESEGLARTDNNDALAAVIDRVLDNNPDTVGQIQGGNNKAIGFLMGQVMKESGGNADPKAVRILLQKKLGL